MRPLLPPALLLLAACAPQPSGSGHSLPDVVAALPTPADPERVRVVVMGDQGTGTDVQRRVAGAMAAVCGRQGCDLGVGLGDNFYPAGPRDPASPLFRERFADVYGKVRTPSGAPLPFLMVPGNHDESGPLGGDGSDARGAEAQVAYGRTNPQWVMPGRAYRAPLGDLVEFFGVDTAPLAPYLPPRRADERPGGPWAAAQRAWLAGALASSSARWRLVLGHHPLFSNGRHGNAGQYDNHLPLPWARGNGVRGLYAATCGHADAILSGHDHALEGFAPQPECPGTRQWVSGAAGEVGGGRRGTRPATFEFYGQPGFLWLDITRRRLTAHVFVVAGDGEAREVAVDEVDKP